MNGKALTDWLRLLLTVTRLLPWLLLITLGLTSCASNPTGSPQSLADCPQLPQIPATLTQSEQDAVSAYSQKLRDYSQKVQNWLLKVDSSLPD